MAVTDPYPGQPTDGQALDAVPILAKFNALFQAIQAFDGSQINAGSVSAAALVSSINPNTLLHDTMQPFVQTGLIWSTVLGLNGTMTSGVLYGSNGSSIFRVSVTGVGSNTFTASKDTYIDIDYNGNITYQAVSNNAASPALTANSIRVAIVVTNGTGITFINQGQTDCTLASFAPVLSSFGLTSFDSLGNPIYPQNPMATNIGYREYASTISYTGSSLGALSPAVSVPFIVPTGGRKCLFSIECTAMQGATTAVVPLLVMYVDSSVIGQAYYNNTGANFNTIYSARRKRFITGGSHTLTLQAASGTSAAMTIEGGVLSSIAYTPSPMSFSVDMV